MSCKYKNIFGEVNTGLHSYRFLNIAIIDVLATILLAYILNRSLLKSYSVRNISIFLFLLSIFFHKIFCVDTTVIKMLRLQKS